MSFLLRLGIVRVDSFLHAASQLAGEALPGQTCSPNGAGTLEAGVEGKLYVWS